VPKLADRNLNVMDKMGFLMDRIPYVTDTTDNLVDSAPFLIDSPAPDGLAAQTGG